MASITITQSMGCACQGSDRKRRRPEQVYLFEEMQYTGKRLTAQECEAHHIIMKACNLDDLMDEVLTFAKALNKDRQLSRKMKLETHKHTLAVIDETIASLSGN